MSANYEDRLRRVIRYIYENPAGDLSLDTLADVAALSRFHWHRVFHAMTGETCADCVRRVRMQRASFLLAQTESSVEDIAAQVGYDNPRSFSRAFREVLHMLPGDFRNGGTPQPPSLTLLTGDTDMYHVETRDLPARHLVGIAHKGAYTEISRTYDELSSLFTYRNLWPLTRGMVAVYYSDPSVVAVQDLESFAAVEVAEGFGDQDGLETRDLSAGRHAVLRLQGPYSGLQAAYDHLYGTWLPQSGDVPSDAAAFEVYINSPMNTAPKDLLTDICVPLS